MLKKGWLWLCIAKDETCFFVQDMFYFCLTWGIILGVVFGVVGLIALAVWREVMLWQIVWAHAFK